ncbi:hypothetical protein ACFOHT_01060 [Massilia oculi]|jgi:hypothetical protein|uniref:hypothetical protein n=1 Tax=Massilia oculi TaxID=945844 RepID=UPI00360F322E
MAALLLHAQAQRAAYHELEGREPEVGLRAAAPGRMLRAPAAGRVHDEHHLTWWPFRPVTKNRAKNGAAITRRYDEC